MSEKVVITGMGVISPLGNNVTDFWDALCIGSSGIEVITKFDVSNYPTQIAGTVKNFLPEDFLDKKEAKRMDRFTHFAVAATKEAIIDAGLNIEKINKDKFGVILGTGIGGVETIENQVLLLKEKGPSRISPFMVPMMIANIAAGQISILTGAKGINFTTVTACAAGSNAIGEAFRAISSGKADIVITGGSEAPITPTSLAGFCAMKAMTTANGEPKKASKPFDANRDGFVMSEGAGILILESYPHAVKRNAKILAEIVGYGLTADAYHITAPAPNGEGGAKAMANAISEAEISPDCIGYINAHGTSTPYNDKFETFAIKSVFNDYAKKVAISSTKSMTGHLLGAAGAVEAVASVNVLRFGFAPPTINLQNDDPDCDLDYIPNIGRKLVTDYVLSNSFGFGGHNVSLLFKKV